MKLNLQFFADPAPADPAPAEPAEPTKPAAKPAQPTQPAQQPEKQPSADDIAAAIFKAADERTKRAESGVVKSMAEQYGISEAEAKAALDKAKAEKAAKLPPEVQKKLDEAESKIRSMQISAEVAKVGAELGLVDADVAMTLIPEKSITIDDKGAVSGVKEALEELKKTKPYLFGVVAKATGARAGAGTTSADDLDPEMLAAIRGGRTPKEKEK